MIYGYLTLIHSAGHKLNSLLVKIDLVPGGSILQLPLGMNSLFWQDVMGNTDVLAMYIALT